MLAPLRALAAGAALAAALLAAAPAQAQSDREPLARFQDPVCPGIVGLRVEAAEQMVGLIRQNVHDLGLRLAPEADCKPNLLVAVLRDGAAFIDTLQRDKAYLFSEMSREEAEALTDETGPVRALLRVRARSRDGMPIARREDLTTPPETAMWMAHSKVYLATRNDILTALVIFDRDAVSGMSVGQLADYATMRALAQTLPENAAERQDSILTLFEGGMPAGLTEFDKAYLAALYEGMPNLPGPARIAYLEAATGRNLFLE